MRTGLPLLAIGLIFGTGIGFTIAAANGITLDGHDHSDPTHHGDHGTTMPGMAGHDHSTRLVLDKAADNPTLDAMLHADPDGSWNLQIRTENFTFSPQNVSGDHVPGEGHVHVYVNAEKIGRYYGSWVHLGAVQAGDVVKITLNANDHRPLAIADAPISASVTIPD
ncbi:hypothetical protein [Aestuariivita sp.]|jgi:hypothetical protein|uniref:hypothetical protein n=1 Tax=Aestuariivita sp. TaxID=1872407 RepID=UPI00216D31A7|nr:hypothetical protein [Aestuariivita sp.]MCE8009630.1 hypothetical protein [Aestuariivita sp.]